MRRDPDAAGSPDAQPAESIWTTSISRRASDPEAPADIREADAAYARGDVVRGVADTDLRLSRATGPRCAITTIP